MGVTAIATGSAGPPAPVPPALAGALTDVAGRVRALAAEIDGAGAAVAHLAGLQWRGSAATAYRETVSDHVLDLRRASDRVDGLAAALDRLQRTVAGP